MIYLSKLNILYLFLFSCLFMDAVYERLTFGAANPITVIGLVVGMLLLPIYLERKPTDKENRFKK